MAHFKSADFRDICQEAKRQGFAIELLKSGHYALTCPTCGHREILSGTGRAKRHEFRHKISRLKRHGFAWQGRQGVHK